MKHVIHLVVYDFDGVMTDNKAIVSQDGTESVVVTRADGIGVGMIKKMNIPQIIMSTETNPVVSARAKKLNIPVMQGVGDKRSRLLQYCEENNVDLKHVAYIGNDINDLEAMQIVGFPFCPADAYPEIKEVSRKILKTNGGDGVVREFWQFLREYNFRD